jgi:hypothetical protein
MSLILTTKRLYELSPDIKTVGGLKLWLKQCNVPYVENGKGSPTVDGEYINTLLGNQSRFNEKLAPTLTMAKNDIGVYLLYQDNEVVYVGMTRSLLGRMASHVRSDFEWDRLEFIHAHPMEIGDIETELIAKHRPKYNLAKIPKIRSTDPLSSGYSGAYEVPVFVEQKTA